MSTQTHLISALRSFSRAAGAAAAIIGGLVLMGWVCSVELLRTGPSGLVTMKANTALCFVLAGLSLWILVTAQGRRGRWLGQALAGIVALVGLLTLTEYLFGWDLGIDRLLLPRAFSLAAPERSVGGSSFLPFPPARMSHLSALDFLMAVVALELFFARRALRFAQTLAVLAALVAMLVLIGYAFGVQALSQGMVFYSRMALHTAAAFVVLCLGLLCARPDAGLMATVTSEVAGGVLARRLL